MGISVFCSGCQKQLNLDERFAGKKVKCKKCGGVLAVPTTSTAAPRTVPARPVAAGAARPASVPRPAGHRPPPPPPPPPPRDEFDDGPSLDDLESLPTPEVKPLVVPAQPTVYTPSKASGIASSVGSGTLGVAKKILFFDMKKVLGGAFAILLIVGTTAKIYRAYTKISGSDPLGNAIADARSAAPAASATVNFPDRPPMSSAGPGIVAGEVRLTNRVGITISVKVYLPEGNYAAQSLPAVMIAPAGSMCITGIALTNGDTEEHLPYVRDGFAVIAYSLSGGFSGDPNTNRRGLQQAAEQFHAAGGGTIDAQDALSYALARFPEIHPDYIVAAGHSSAATHALMLSYKEPRIKAVAAYSPALNLQERFGADASVLQRDLPRIRRWLDEYSADTLGTPRCPLMIFHARDDDNTPFADSAGFAKKYPSQVTLVPSNSGGHSGALMSTGVPAGIRFFRANVSGLPPKPTPLLAGTPPAAQAPVEVVAPAAPNSITIAPMPAPPTGQVPITITGNTIEYDGTTIKLAPPPMMRASGVSQQNNQVRMSWQGTGTNLTVTITRRFGGNGAWATTEIPVPPRLKGDMPGYRANFDRIGDGVHIRMEASAKARSPVLVTQFESARDGTSISR
jgi:fermentation-respiration switch protein FrsA (DUF1100 family)